MIKPGLTEAFKPSWYPTDKQQVIAPDRFAFSDGWDMLLRVLWQAIGMEEITEEEASWLLFHIESDFIWASISAKLDTYKAAQS